MSQRGRIVGRMGLDHRIIRHLMRLAGSPRKQELAGRRLRRPDPGQLSSHGASLEDSCSREKQLRRNSRPSVPLVHELVSVVETAGTRDKLDHVTGAAYGGCSARRSDHLYVSRRVCPPRTTRRDAGERETDLAGSCVAQANPLVRWGTNAGPARMSAWSPKRTSAADCRIPEAIVRSEMAGRLLVGERRRAGSPARTRASVAMR